MKEEEGKEGKEEWDTGRIGRRAGEEGKREERKGVQGGRRTAGGGGGEGGVLEPGRRAKMGPSIFCGSINIVVNYNQAQNPLS